MIDMDYYFPIRQSSRPLVGPESCVSCSMIDFIDGDILVFIRENVEGLVISKWEMTKGGWLLVAKIIHRDN